MVLKWFDLEHDYAADFDISFVVPPPLPSQPPAKKFLMLVTWVTPYQPTTNYQVVFDSQASCQDARVQIMRDAERMRKEIIDNAPDKEIGQMYSMQISVSAVCVPQ